MKQVYIVSDSMISPLGKTSEENFNNAVVGKSGVRNIDGVCLSKIDHNITFDGLCLDALNDLQHHSEFNPERTLLLLSTTKGNIFLSLHDIARRLATAAGVKKFQVVSNACSSGVAALLVARRFLQGGQFDHTIVIGAEVLSDFVISGFKSLLALSDEPCRPFDADRKGVNLGEAVGAVLLSTVPDKNSIAIEGVAMTNDANHISGPSRTGSELASAISSAIQQASINPQDIDFISAHGTATIYNDEMETKAFHLAGVDSRPVHSLKGYFGHTLGAAGLIETIMCTQMLKRQTTIASAGFSKHGVSLPLNICSTSQKMSLRKILKTASGFGGTNAAMILSL